MQEKRSIFTKVTALFLSGAYESASGKKSNDPKTLIGDEDSTAFISKERAIQCMGSVNGKSQIMPLTYNGVKHSMESINVFEVI